MNRIPPTSTVRRCQSFSSRSAVDTVDSTLEEEKRGGAYAVLYYGFTLYAAYSGVRNALAILRDRQSAEGVAGIRDAIPEFEALLDYDGFLERHEQYGSKAV